MVAPTMDYSGLHKPSQSIDHFIAKYGPLDDIEVKEARKIQDKHYGVIMAVVYGELAKSRTREKAWKKMRLFKSIRDNVKEILKTDYKPWSFFSQVKAIILDIAPPAAIYQLLGIELDPDDPFDDADRNSRVRGGRSSPV